MGDIYAHNDQLDAKAVFSTPSLEAIRVLQQEAPPGFAAALRITKTILYQELQERHQAFNDVSKQLADAQQYIHAIEWAEKQYREGFALVVQAVKERLDPNNEKTLEEVIGMNPDDLDYAGLAHLISDQLMHH